jgi:hypothetical protein
MNTTTSTPTYTSGNFLLAPQADTSTVLTLDSGQIYISGSTTPQSSITLDSTGAGLSQLFTIGGDSEYAEGYVTITYNSGADTAECHMNFFLGTTSWNQDSSGSFPNDNTTIIPAASSSATPTLIPVTQPTGGGSSGIDTLYQVLDPEMVALVDYYPENKTMLFRGNTPFNTPATSNGQQSVDFESLHKYMKAKYESQTGNTDFPAFNNYKLRDVCLQSTASEGGSILWELDSFGGTELSQLANQVWYPADVPGAQNQMNNWEIEPHNLPGNDTFDMDAVKKLSAWMSPATVPDTYHIYYIHCASGHDRTGIVASAYMIANRQFSLNRSLIYGTTIAKLSTGSGQLQVNCTDIDGTNKGNTDPDRSRIMMIANVYDDTVLNIYNSIANPTTPATALPTQAMAENPAYVYSTYPWEKSL